MSTNDITGDEIKTKTPSDSYRDGWDRIFGKKADDKKDTPVKTSKKKADDKKDTPVKTKAPNKTK